MGAGIVLAALTAACGGATLPPASPSPSDTAVIAPSPTANPTPSASPASPSPAPTPSPAPIASPRPSVRAKPLPSVDIAKFLTARIKLLDLTEADLRVAVSYVDPDSGQAISLGTYDLGPLEQLSNGIAEGRYRFAFSSSSGNATKGTCTIDVKVGDAYTFAAVTGAIAVTRAKSTPKSTRDLFVATSSLCRK